MSENELKKISRKENSKDNNELKLRKIIPKITKSWEAKISQIISL